MNYIKNNRQGLFFGFEQVNGSAANIPSDIKIYDNSFVTNEMQLSGCVCKVYNFTEAIHSWEYNGHGNYWSDYNGTDADHNGIGDTYYEIDPLNFDPNPLVASPAKAPIPPAQFPTTIIVAAVIAFVIVILAVLLVLRRKRAWRS
jgi:nitrous oxidase accessory protein NosD